MISHVLEAKLPEFFIFVWIQMSVVSGMFVPSAVAEPDIIASIGKNEGRSLVFVIDDPSIRAIKQAMLEPDGFQPLLHGSVLLLNPKEGEQVAIICLNDMLFDGIMVVIAVLDERILGFWVDFAESKKGKQEKNSNFQHWRFTINNII